MSTKRPVLFLDVDGTVRHCKDDVVPGFVNGPEDVVVFQDALQRIHEAIDNGYLIAFVSNQGGIGAGLSDEDLVVAAFDKTLDSLMLGPDGPVLVYCPDDPKHPTPMRKPGPGMIFHAYNHFIKVHGEGCVDWDRSVMVGDRPEDEECARRAGVKFITAEQWREHGTGG